MRTYKSVSQIRRSGNIHGTKTIVTAKFQGFSYSCRFYGVYTLNERQPFQNHKYSSIVIFSPGLKSCKYLSLSSSIKYLNFLTELSESNLKESEKMFY